MAGFFPAILGRGRVSRFIVFVRPWGPEEPNRKAPVWKHNRIPRFGCSGGALGELWGRSGNVRTGKECSLARRKKRYSRPSVRRKGCWITRAALGDKQGESNFCPWFCYSVLAPTESVLALIAFAPPPKLVARGGRRSGKSFHLASEVGEIESCLFEDNSS